MSVLFLKFLLVAQTLFFLVACTKADSNLPTQRHGSANEQGASGEEGLPHRNCHFANGGRLLICRSNFEDLSSFERGPVGKNFYIRIFGEFVKDEDSYYLREVEGSVRVKKIKIVSESCEIAKLYVACDTLAGRQITAFGFYMAYEKTEPGHDDSVLGKMLLVNYGNGNLDDFRVE